MTPKELKNIYKALLLIGAVYKQDGGEHMKEFNELINLIAQEGAGLELS